MQKLTPKQLDLPEDEETVNWPMWQLGIEELKQIDHLKTPHQKQLALSKAFVVVQASYKLSFPGKMKLAGSDFIIPALMCILLRTQLQNPFAI